MLRKILVTLLFFPAISLSASAFDYAGIGLRSSHDELKIKFPTSRIDKYPDLYIWISKQDSYDGIYYIGKSNIKGISKIKIGLAKPLDQLPKSESYNEIINDRFPKCGKVLQNVLNRFGSPTSEYEIRDGAPHVVFTWYNSTEKMQLICLVTGGEIVGQEIWIQSRRAN